VARLFEPEREAIGKVIWQAMNDVPSEELLARVNAARVLAELPWASTNSVRATGTDRITAPVGLGAPSPNREREESSGVSAHVSEAARAVDAAGTVAGARSKDSPTPGPLRRRAPWLLAIGGGLVALLAALGSPLTAGTREPIIVDVPAPVTRVRLNLQATPPSARFVLDGQPLDSNPYQGERAMDAFPHALEVSAEGHQRRSIEVHLNRDLDLDVRLAEEPPPRPSTAAAVPPSSSEPGSPPVAHRAHAPSPRTDLPREASRSAPPARRAPESVRAASAPAPRTSSQSADDIYPDDPLPAPKPAPLEAY
jgi:hypothetical protein